MTFIHRHIKLTRDDFRTIIKFVTRIITFLQEVKERAIETTRAAAAISKQEKIIK